MNNVVGWVPPNNLSRLVPPHDQPKSSSHLKPYKYDQIGWNNSLGNSDITAM